MSKLLEMHGISKSFYGTQALKDVDIKIEPGEIQAVCGENGAGKSTLMNIMTGILQADSGKIVFEGQELTDLNPRTAQEKGISIVHQELSLCPEVSVAENIFMGRVPEKKRGMVNFKQMRQEAEKVLDRLNLEIDVKKPVGKLGISEQQMVEIAKALSINAKILILDEPTSSLTDTESQILFENLMRLKEEGIAIFFISHRLKEIFQVCDSYTVLRDGEHVGNGKIEDVDPDDIVRMMVGRELDQAYPDKGTEVGKNILKVENISRKNEFKNVSFEVNEKEIVGLFGLIGAGRSETMRTVFGINQPESGKIELLDEDITANNTRKNIDQGLIYITEDRKEQGLFLDMDLNANVVAADLEQVSENSLVKKKKVNKIGEKFVEIMNTKYASLDQPVRSLSGGNQQKVLLAKWLAVEPRVLILDEPTRGIDVGAKFEIHSTLRELSNNGHGVMFISSELPEILGLSDRILVMHQGELVGELDAEGATEEDIMMYASGRKNDFKN
ncbi:ribose transport system ATP-binding protein [Halanaerobium saccharolyticum]|uniref:Ribose transport system ATP-binding protein n=1 Tax=Halanaerobium saccharolyticum TaxID=43595 RepID=A0A4R7Z0D8_9FIRM|nr:sugar ABC transporter ATP-binding protein [Halanaerobium saccharolyticum]RAK07209.1 ribose transport system ATP-binding protein [Halanaerobium saccharolyticum]TDW02122.1 ribose transport system ATP-binding protein [Halanaerobium saccharolyticum]TDX58853.1 ribose transport system ATP-binding protein [Halanaerobium saccharolyticum]